MENGQVLDLHLFKRLSSFWTTVYSNEEIFVTSAYELGKDFLLTAGSDILGGNGLVSINKIGKVDLPKEASIAIKNNPMVTYSNGRCYQLNLEVEKVELMYIDFHFYFWSAVKPKKVKVSNCNSVELLLKCIEKIFLL